MEIKPIDNLKVENNEMVRIKEMGNITEVMWSDSYFSKCHIKRLNKDFYIDLRTGETKEFKHIENRACDLASVSKSLGKLRDYLNTNITDVSKCRWVTLTYAENMTDPKKLYNDFKLFNRELRKQVGHYEYIVAMEPQGRGAWHCHVVMIFDKKAPFIHNDIIWSCWSKKGFKQRSIDGKGYNYTVTKKLDDVDNVGAYLTAYLGDMEVSEVLETGLINDYLGKQVKIKEVEVEENGEMKSKKYIKGARLRLYPPKFNIFRCSRGIKSPIVYYDSEEMAQKKVSSAKLTFEKTIQLSDKENDFEKTISYRYYNKIRKE